MDSSRTLSSKQIRVLRWIARGLGAALLLIWGAFFVEHMQWFSDPEKLPPRWVFLSVGLHGLMLVALLVAWRFERIGGLLVLASAVPFFAKTAGDNAILYIAITAVPAILWIVCNGRERARGAPTPEAGPKLRPST